MTVVHVSYGGLSPVDRFLAIASAERIAPLLRQLARTVGLDRRARPLL